MSQQPADPQFQAARAHHQAGRYAEAEALYGQLLALQPQNAAALNFMGVLHIQTARPETGVEFLRRAVDAMPNNASYHCNLGIAFKASGRSDQAIACYRAAIALRPDMPEAHNNLGNIQRDRGDLDASIASCREALRLKPDYPDAFNNLGIALQLKGDLDAAAAALRRAIALRPAFAEAQNNLGTTLKARGELDEALAAYREAVRLRPTYADAHSNLLYAMHFHAAIDAVALRQEHAIWNRQHAEPLKPFQQLHAASREPNRRLRIGYVSPDFRGHAVGLFMAPLLAAHDHSAFEVFCYSDVLVPDALTAHLRASADHWRSIVGMPDAQAAALIAQDKIDILIDLTMHMAHNRLRLFARKPAPVQVTYLAYCSTTGVEAIDYRVSDPHLDPPEIAAETIYSEKTIRLPDTYWCYALTQGIEVPEPNALPALRNGHITFGCLNNFTKISDLTLDTWVTLLQKLPNSRLILHADLGTHRARVLQHLEGHTISPNRCEFFPLSPTADYFRQYHRIDIALDPFPYAGGTTTLDALFMGIPVITLRGQTAVGRGGVSILSNLSLPELIAQTTDDYLRIATDLANDLPPLALLRQTLRPRLQASPLMDAPRFTRNLEAAYQKIWNHHCVP